jgi:2-keto-4-pentenoate hydratase/2-oxohepta-3-ene-1,7-dioic acid hydratase in catechol pathway
MLPPVQPSKVVCVGRNYRDHAVEVNKPIPAEPVIFLKPPSALAADGEPIRVPPGVGRVEYEAEVAVVIKTRAFRASRDAAAGHVLGFCCANDVTARDLQRRGVQYAHCKGYDSFAPIGPCIATGLDPPLTLECWVNGELRQSSSTRELIFPIDELIAYISSIMTLVPGDVILTGTPAGVGALNDGDDVVVKVEGVGTLSNHVQIQETRTGGAL